MQQGAGDWLELCLKSCLKPQAGRLVGKYSFLETLQFCLPESASHFLPVCILHTLRYTVGLAPVFLLLLSFFSCLLCSFGVLSAMRVGLFLKGGFVTGFWEQLGLLCKVKTLGYKNEEEETWRRFSILT